MKYIHSYVLIFLINFRTKKRGLIDKKTLTINKLKFENIHKKYK